MYNTFYIEDNAWDKIISYARSCYKLLKTEIAGMAVIIKEDDKWIIQDPTILKQEVSSTICHLDKEELGLWYASMADKYKDYLGGKLKYLWWHSHHNMTATMSGTDWNTIRQTDSSVSLVVNNDGEYQLIYRGGDPEIEVECKLQKVNKMYENTAIEDEINQLVTKEQAVQTNTLYRPFKSLRDEIGEDYQTRLWNDSFNKKKKKKKKKKKVKLVNETITEDRLTEIELEIDQMIDMKEPFDKLHAYILSQNEIYSETLFSLPTKEAYESGKINSAFDLMTKGEMIHV